MNTIFSGLILGGAFGYVLERAGFGNPCKLTAQFRLTDWSVFKVMFTAIVFAAVGLMIVERLGLIDASDLFVPPAFLGAAALGGALVGAGFAIGGYCPGTSVVGLMSGRIDAGIFLVGLSGMQEQTGAQRGLHRMRIVRLERVRGSLILRR